jgi:phosphatidate cytidylyltransferase
MNNFHPHVQNVLGGIVALLIVASIVTTYLRKVKGPGKFDELVLRVKTWWILVGIFTTAMMLPVNYAVGFFAFVSFLALKEYFSMIPTRRADRRVIFWAYAGIILQYYWVATAWYGLFIIFIPVYMFLFIPMRVILIGETKGYLQAIGTIHWGLMTTVFCVSHLAYLLVLPQNGNPNGGGVGLVLCVTFLSQFNDVAQYFWGKLFGKHKVVPTVSPNKTYQGLIGGVSTTVVTAYFLGPYLTPLDNFYSAVAGLIIGLFGFIGDVTISALKRDVGLKDSGQLLPGHGGILDRIDSLYFTVPLFFHYLYYLKY